MIKPHGKHIRQLLGCLIFIYAGCKNHQPYQHIVETKADSLKKVAVINRAWDSIYAVQKKIRTGDLVTRTGNDFTSETFRKMNQRDPTYSHCGIASIENDTVFIYHALGGEWNPDQKIRRDPFPVFAEPYNNKGIGLFHFSIDDKLANDILSFTKSLYDRGVMFDLSFDLQSDDRMYCAEFIYKCYAVGSRNALSFNRSFIQSFEFVGVDDLFLQEQCQPVHKLVYK